MATIFDLALDSQVVTILSPGEDWKELPRVVKITDTNDTKLFQCPSGHHAEISLKVYSKKVCSVKILISTVETYSNLFFESEFSIKNVNVGPGQSVYILTDDIGNGVDVRANIDGRVYGPHDYEAFR